jgi:hypothetical protein
VTSRDGAGYLRGMRPPADRPRRAFPAGFPTLALSALAALLGAGCASAASGTGESFAAIQSTAAPAASARYVGVLTVGEGRLQLTGSDTDSVLVHYAVNARSRNDLFASPVQIIEKGDTLLVTIEPLPNASLDLQVEMPEHVTLALRDQARDVTVRGIDSRVEVALHSGGSLEFDDIEGPLTILDGGGPIRVHDVRGPIDIRDEGGPITIHKVANGVSIDSKIGDITLESVRGDVRLSMGAGNLTVHGVTGKLSYRKAGAGKVTIEDVTGGVEKL